MKKKRIVLLGITLIFLLILIFFINYQSIQKEKKITKYGNSPCYYFLSNQSYVKLLGINSSEVDLYRSGKSLKFFFLKKEDKKEIPKCSGEEVNYVEIGKKIIQKKEINKEFLNFYGKQIGKKEWIIDKYRVYLP